MKFYVESQGFQQELVTGKNCLCEAKQLSIFSAINKPMVKNKPLLAYIFHSFCHLLQNLLKPLEITHWTTCVTNLNIVNMICVGHLKFGCNDRLLNFNYDGTQRINCLQFDFELMI